MREPRPGWSPLGVNFKIPDEHPHLFYIQVSPAPLPGDASQENWIEYRNARLFAKINEKSKEHFLSWFDLFRLAFLFFFKFLRLMTFQLCDGTL